MAPRTRNGNNSQRSATSTARTTQAVSSAVSRAESHSDFSLLPTPRGSYAIPSRGVHFPHELDNNDSNPVSHWGRKMESSVSSTVCAARGSLELPVYDLVGSGRVLRHWSGRENGLG